MKQRSHFWTVCNNTLIVKLWAQSSADQMTSEPRLGAEVARGRSDLTDRVRTSRKYPGHILGMPSAAGPTPDSASQSADDMIFRGVPA